jgi:hypothetical protein
MPYADEVVNEVIALVRAGRFVDQALKSATERLVVAGDALVQLPQGEPRLILEKLGRFLVDRVEAARS